MVLGSCGLVASIAAAAGPIGAGQDFVPCLAAVACLIDSAFVVVVPQVAGGAGKHIVAVGGIHQDARDALRVFQANVGPVFATVRGLVNTIAH